MRRLPATDIVICGLGWAGSIVLHELSQAGLDIVALERGAFPTPAPGLPLGAREQDDLKGLRGAMMQDLSRDTLTHRHDAGHQARPMDRFGAFLLGEVVGGAGVTWNGINTRFMPHDFEFRSHLRRAGRLDAMPDDLQVSDFGLTFDELEADYDWFERITGTSGRAGNLGGAPVAGGNPFEGSRSGEYPNPPLPESLSGRLFRQASDALGYHPYPIPAREHVPGLHQPARHGAEELRVLRLLRPVPLPDRRQGKPDQHDPARRRGPCQCGDPPAFAGAEGGFVGRLRTRSRRRV